MTQEEIVNLSIKKQLTPGYLQTVMGMINPNKKGMNADGTFDAFIEETDDGRYVLKQGFSIIGTYNDLNKAKNKKADLPPLTADTVKKKFGDEYVKSEKAARKYVESKGKSYSKLPVKNQFILANYHLTGHKNEDLFDAVINNDFKKTVANYQRKGLEQAGEFFKTVMFPSPMGENDLANANQAQNLSEKVLDQLYPDNKSLGAEGGKAEAIAEFTGGELVNNKEDEMRSAMKKGDNKKAAKIFRSQVKNKNITPGEASHTTNPLPVAADGRVMDKKGKSTGQKAKPGAGIYDHIKKQYNPNMTDDQVIEMVKKNHAKWRKNNMA
jgi:hypothetical protein|tara:strand:+ start:219 stop:1193 length:975 start_codon:yes stop_codon:yes gene_type:complete